LPIGGGTDALVTRRRDLERRPPDSPDTEPEPGRRSWSDNTPLPPAVPHHVADPTLRLRKASASDLPIAEDAPTRPGSDDGVLPEVSGIASAPRRSSATLIAASARADDLSVELYRRRLPALPPDALAK